MKTLLSIMIAALLAVIPAYATDIALKTGSDGTTRVLWTPAQDVSCRISINRSEISVLAATDGFMTTALIREGSFSGTNDKVPAYEPITLDPDTWKLRQEKGDLFSQYCRPSLEQSILAQLPIEARSLLERSDLLNGIYDF